MKKILIIRFSSIGDIVLTSPVIRCLKEQLPVGSEVHIITKDQYSKIHKGNPHIDKIFSLDNDFSKTVKKLKDENYDHIVDLHKNIRSKRLIFMLRKPSSTFSKLNVEKWLLVNLKWNRLPKRHIVDRYFEAVSTLGVKNDDNGLEYFINPEEEVGIDNLPSIFQNGFVAFAFGAKFATKAIPISLVSKIIEQIDLPIVLVGSESEVESAKMISEQK